MFDNWGQILEEVKKLGDDQRGPFVTWLVVSVVRDIAYYSVVGLVAWTLGRRLINGVLSAVREASRAGGDS
jgi:hypothetical protein